MQKQRWLALFRLEAKTWLGSRWVRLALSSLLALGLLAVYLGVTERNRQADVIASFPASEKSQALELAKKYPGVTDAGMTLYYLNFHPAHAPTPWAALAMGQRDVHPWILPVKLLGLEAQLYDSDLSNPTQSLAGGFDLAFVLVFLLPLLIIALTFDAVSRERESGRWRLLLAQGFAPVKIILAKFILRGAVILAVTACLGLIGLLWAGNGPQHSTGSIVHGILLVGAYAFFWLSACFAVASLQMGSRTNAALLFGAWILTAVALPASLNTFIATAYPVDEGRELTLAQRQEMHSLWDRPKDETLRRFFVNHPEWSDTPPVTGRFAWKWYYAMHQVADEYVAATALKYREKLQYRRKIAEWAALLSPPANAQLRLQALARTDLKSHLEYLDAVRDFHGGLRNLYYPHFFHDKPFANEEVGKMPRLVFDDRQPDSWPAKAAGLGALWIPAMVLTGLGLLWPIRNGRRNA